VKDLSYLNAFDKKIIREARRIIYHGITVKDIDRYFEQLIKPVEVKQVSKEKWGKD